MTFLTSFWSFLDLHNGAVTACATALIAVFTVVLVYATAQQARLTKIVASAARDSADASIEAERAFIFTTIEGQNVQERVGAFVAHPHNAAAFALTSLAVAYEIKNYGKTPAIVRRISVKLRHAELPDSGQDPALTYYPPLDTGEIIIAANDRTGGTINLHDPFGLQDAIDVEQADSTVWFFGEILYADVFGKDHVHRFLWGYNGQWAHFRSHPYKNYNAST